jgi:MFS family permease
MATEQQGPASIRTVPAHHGAVLLVAAAAALGGFLFGYDTAVINGTVDAIKSQFDISSTYVGFVVSSALLGCAVGAWFAGPTFGLQAIAWPASCSRCSSSSSVST